MRPNDLRNRKANFFFIRNSSKTLNQISRCLELIENKKFKATWLSNIKHFYSSRFLYRSRVYCVHIYELMLSVC